MQPAKLNVETLQAYLRDLYEGKVGEQSLFMKLVEEMGEVAEVLNKRSGRKAAQGQNLEQQLGEELADLIHYTVAIAAVNDLDLSGIILEKDRKASEKYHRESTLTDYLGKEE